jgi:uncharacterized protein YhbP (UPF0306 family)
MDNRQTTDTEALQPDQRMVMFLRRHHLLTLATCHDNQPWCCNCFYAYIDRLCGLVFTSDTSTRHIAEAMQQPTVAGSVALESTVVGKLQGIQLEGRLTEADGELLKEIKTAYLKRFPFAILMDTKLWLLELSSMKMTDNRLGFGKKLYWRRSAEGASA